MSTYGEQDIICPYYQKENKNQIQCEGLISTEYYGGRQFDTPTQLKAFQKLYCKGNYKNCEYALALEKRRGEVKVYKTNIRIREEIRIHGLTQYKVAEAIGISEPTFTRWMRKEMNSYQKKKVNTAILSLI